MARRNQEEQSVFVKDYLGCGMSLRTYALEKGIGVSTLSRWVRQYTKTNFWQGPESINVAIDRPASCPPAFIELVEAEDDIKKPGSDCLVRDIEIILPSQIVVKVGCLLPEALVVLVQGLNHAHPST
jgi:transposase-like protein